MKKIIIIGIALISITCSFAQNGFVITGKLPKFPIRSFSNNTFITIEGEILSAFDSTGRKILESKTIKHFADGLFIVDSMVNSNLIYYGVINTNGETVIPKKYHEIGKLSDGLALVKNGVSKYGYINIKGVTILPITFKNATDFSEGVAMVECDFMNWGIINNKGNYIFPCRDPSGPLSGLFGAQPFANGFSVVNVEDLNLNKYSIISKKGKQLIPPTNDIPNVITKNIFIANKNVYLYNEGNDSATILSITNPKKLANGFVSAKQNNDNFVYNSYGKMMFKIPLGYNIQGLSGNAFCAYDTITKTYCLLDSTGKTIFPNAQNKILIDKIYPAYDGYFGIVKDNLFGIINDKGKIIAPPQFTNLDWRWYGFNDGNFFSKNAVAEYLGECIIFRLKTTAELKAEEQLIAQKKLPTADECFKKAKGWVENQKVQKAVVASNNNNSQTPNPDDSFEKRNSKEQVLGRQVANYVKYVDWYNESLSKFMNELTACMNAPKTKTCLDEHWRHTTDAGYAWVGITQNLKRIKSELNEIKKINYSYLCPNNNSSILKKIETNMKEIDVLLDGFEISTNADMKSLQGSSMEGKDFATFANELKYFNEFKSKKFMPHLLTIGDSEDALKKLLAGCK